MGELRYLRKEDAYKVGYEPWGPSPLDNIAPPTKSEGSAWFAIGILATVTVLIVVLVVAAVLL